MTGHPAAIAKRSDDSPAGVNTSSRAVDYRCTAPFVRPSITDTLFACVLTT